MFTTVRPNVRNVVQSTFSSFVSSAKFALLKIGSRVELTFPDSIVEYLASEYPGEFVFGTLERATTLPGLWWTKHLGSLLGNVEHPALQVSTGFYLFHLGKVVGYHSGSRGFTDEEAVKGLKVVAFSVLVDLAFRTNRLTSSLASEEERKDVDALLRHLEPLIQECRRSSQARNDGGASRPSDEPGKKEDSPPELDPYEVLGVSRTATELEVKRAYRDRILENHPDKVAKMSAALRRLAEQETKKINAAYALIKLERTWTDAPPEPDAAAPEHAASKEAARSAAPAATAADETVSEKPKPRRASRQRGSAGKESTAVGKTPKRIVGPSGRGSRDK